MWFDMPKRTRLSRKGSKTKMSRLKSASDPIARIRGKQIVIKGLRWFDKINGNTYHSTEVYVGGKLIGKEPFSYGYGEQFYQTGIDILAKKGYITWNKSDKVVPVKNRMTGKISSYTKQEDLNKDKAYMKFRDYVRDHHNRVMTFVDDVARKRDL